MHRDLRALFEPRSVAVVGASGDASKWGGDVSVRLLRGAHRRSVYLVNGRGGEILGQRAFTSLRDLPEAPEFVILTMPAKLLETVVDDCVAVGAKVVVAVTAMLGEMGVEGKARERAAVERLRAAGAALVGPNCLGVADTRSELFAVAYLDVRPGCIGLISQSGGFGEELNLRFSEFGLGFSRFVAIGNQADVDTPTVLRSFVGHEPTRAVSSMPKRCAMASSSLERRMSSCPRARPSFCSRRAALTRVRELRVLTQDRSRPTRSSWMRRAALRVSCG